MQQGRHVAPQPVHVCPIGDQLPDIFEGGLLVDHSLHSGQHIGVWHSALKAAPLAVPSLGAKPGAVHAPSLRFATAAPENFSANARKLKTRAVSDFSA
mmetsp:Transcript_83725/g.159861  ORF Transcript_83725/g.159861 Transcript_83725/m.159861 type:complete len:98 (-) Transcript_83725:147-440(-)